MKRLFASLAIASLALLSIGSVAVAAPDPAVAFSTLSPVPAAAPLAADHVTACQLLIVEDRDACVFTVVAGTSCPAEVIASVQRTGARLLTTNAFLASCMLRPSGGEAPS